MNDSNMLGVTRIFQQGSLSLQVSKQLEALIVSGNIAVGDKLPTENALCDMFGVSRTVIREAITHLKSLGLVETRRGVGTRILRTTAEEAYPAKRISLTTVEDIMNILELRLTLEPEAAAMAASRHNAADDRRLKEKHAAFINACEHHSQAREEDFAFHHAIMQATHNPLFADFYASLNTGAIPRAKLLAVELDSASTRRYLERVCQEHEAILDAIVAGDSAGAKQAMHFHLSRARETYSHYRDKPQDDERSLRSSKTNEEKA
ncbi:FadR/GntR family transcriptional regulator [Phytohalomonas tamaricis]|uniref:FadR/GntR family transcriptional regulator n=1 Tax=Phytohalomonas tamaricis TaxID=2081032 RepID=UPI000D0BB16A|nr:FadR/GntR family transcriptional regulator [Phytohalomonas tamaricis]